MGACQELFCISEDFCASGMQVAEVTKSLMTLSYFHRQQKKIEPRELSDCLFPVTPWFEFHSKKPLCLLSEWLMFCRKNSFVDMQAKLLWNYYVTNLHFFLLAETLAASVSNSGGVYFVPAFSGLYAPYWQTDARGFVYLVLIFMWRV